MVKNCDRGLENATRGRTPSQQITYISYLILSYLILSLSYDIQAKALLPRVSYIGPCREQVNMAIFSPTKDISG